MKLSELRPCDSCAGPVGPMFYVARLSLAFVSHAAARGVGGLVTMFGGLENRGALKVAEAMAPDAEVVKIAGDEDPKLQTELILCQDCTVERLGLALSRREEAERDDPEEILLEESAPQGGP